MEGKLTIAPREVSWRQRIRRACAYVQSRPEVADRVLLVAWTLTRFILLLGVILGKQYTDPAFYNYAGQFAMGKLPYRDLPVEYPPLAFVLILLPALPLLAMPRFAPRPDPAFHAPYTHLPIPVDIDRYGAYGISFAVEMLAIDLLTLWLVRRAARRVVRGDASGLWSGLLYVGLIFVSGALLQKFDLAVGMLCLAAVVALIERRPRLAWTLLAGAVLIKGVPLVVVPVFALYEVRRAGGWSAWRAAAREVAAGLSAFVAVVAGVTLAVAFTAGIASLVHTLLYHASRGVEIESLYANVALAIGWLPGLAARTGFQSDGLARVVISPVTASVNAAVSVGVTSCLLALAFVGSLLATKRWAPSRDAAHTQADVTAKYASEQLLVLGCIAMLCAFLLGFLALPSHYLLVLLPLVAVARPPSARLTAMLFGGVLVAPALGQALAGDLWHALVDLQPLAVALLSVRNVAWGSAFVAAVLSPVVLSRALAVKAPERPVIARRARQRIESRARAGVRWARRLASSQPLPGFSPRREDVFVHLVETVPARRLIVACGAISVLIYFAFVLAFPLTTYWDQPHVGNDVSAINDMGAITGYSPLAAVSFVIAILALCACQFFALHAANRMQTNTASRSARWLVLLFPVLFVVVMIWMQPVTTTDLYGYVARGYLYAQVHLNPMTNPATRLPGYLTVNRPASPYGPAWLLLLGGVSLLTGENLLANLIVLKIIAGVFVIAAILLVDWLAARLFPRSRLRIDVLFAWSPLLIFEAVGNGHNDIAMMVCVLGAYALMLKRWSRTAFALLVLGALVKYVSAVFVVLWLAYEVRHRVRSTHVLAKAADEKGAAHQPTGDRVSWRDEARRLWASVRVIDLRPAVGLLISVTLIGAVMTAAFYAPFWHGLKTFTGLGQQVRPLYYNDSPVDFLTAPLRLLLTQGQDIAFDKTIRLMLYVLFGIYTVIQTRRLWLLGPAADMRDVLTASAKLAFAALLLITFWFQPWYVVWLLPLAALSRETFVRRAATILAVGALLTYAVGNFLLVSEHGLGRDLFVQFFEILVTYVPLLLLRAAPYEQGWVQIFRRYARLVGVGLTVRPVFWQRVMLALVLIVAALLRLLLLGNLFVQMSATGSPTSALKQVSADLRLVLVDPQGMQGPFGAIQQGLVVVFGSTPFAALLPSAVIGTITVFVVYLLANEILSQGGHGGAKVVALLAALLAATSSWHVSLSRSGMEVVLLPLLVCLALYWLLLAFRLSTPVVEVSKSSRRRRRRSRSSRVRPAQVGLVPESRVDEKAQWRRQLLLFAGCGVCTGLACDLAPGLWLLPILVVGFVLAWRRQSASWTAPTWRGLGALVLAAAVTGIPCAGYFVSRAVGFPQGSAVLARTSAAPRPGPGLLSGEFWGQVATNVGDVLHVLIAQDYGAGYPAVGGTPIIPAILTPFFLLGLLIVVVQWRKPSSLFLLLLVALPVAASVAVGTPSGVIEAASVLPATCIIPALALYETGAFLGHLPIVLDRMNGARVFSTPEQIGRIVLFLFLLISTVRTFYWYFEASLPAQQIVPVNTPSYVGPPPVVAYSPPGDGRVQQSHGTPQTDIRRTTLSVRENAGIVHVQYVLVF